MSPSGWVVRWSRAIEPGGQVLDLACGAGRHVRHFLARGHPVTAVDRDLSDLQDLDHPGLERIEADLESGPWPLPGRRYAAVIVTNYLHRPLFPALVDAVAPGGLLVYETFAQGQEHYGRPRNPDFLLRPGELIERVHPLTVAAYEHGLTDRPALVQRIAAHAGGGTPPSLARAD